MMLAATILGVSILGLGALFYIKHWEEKHVRIFMPGMRLAADEKALQLKSVLQRAKAEFQKLGPTSLRITRVVLHDLALWLAALSRASERQAHRLADLVSHKHRFERRESKNEFLKQVAETPIRNIREVTPVVPVAPVETQRPVMPEPVIVNTEPAASRPIPASQVTPSMEDDETFVEPAPKPMPEAKPVVNSNVEVVDKSKRKKGVSKKKGSGQSF